MAHRVEHIREFHVSRIPNSKQSNSQFQNFQILKRFFCLVKDILPEKKFFKVFQVELIGKGTIKVISNLRIKGKETDTFRSPVILILAG
jgi:hypothetical protein